MALKNMEKKLMNLFLFSLTISFATACFTITSDNDKADSKEVSTKMVEDSISTVLKRKIQLIEAVLNLPEVIELSKFEVIKKARPNIYILLDENLFAGAVPMITQNGYQLTVLRSLDTLDTSMQPCYVFTRMELNENSATVQMLYDITGLWVNGKLNYVEGKWIADETLRVTVR